MGVPSSMDVLCHPSCQFNDIIWYVFEIQKNKPLVEAIDSSDLPHQERHRRVLDVL